MRGIVAFLCAFWLLLLGLTGAQQRSFTIDYDADTFRMDGRPFRYVSG